METIAPSQLEIVSTSPVCSRSPLSSATNSGPQIRTGSQRKRIRRKPSSIRRVDSSEDIPSSHESIFQAERFSSANSEDDDTRSLPKVTLSHTMMPTASIDPVEKNENIRDQLLYPIIGSRPILYGHGTALSTIVEQKSSATMSTKVSSAHPGSNSEVSLARTLIPNLLGHRNSSDLSSTVAIRSPRQRKSFSADDIAFIKRAYHEACVMIERNTNNSLHMYNVYAKPLAPILPPFERPPTPPGMPSWTTAQNGTVQNIVQSQHLVVGGIRKRLQRILCIRPRPGELSSPVPVSIALQHSRPGTQVIEGLRSSSSPLTARMAPRFRPTKSGYGVGPLESHPFHQASRVEAKSDIISTTARAQTHNSPLSSQPGASQRLLKTASRGNRRRATYSHIAGGAQTSSQSAFALNSIVIGHDKISTQCPHRQARQVSLRSLKPYTDLEPPNHSHSTVNYALLASNDPRGNATEEPISPPFVPETQPRSETRAATLHVLNPVMTGAVPPAAQLAALPIKPSPQTHRCWRCHISKFASILDEIWESSTSWCCWVFCGVDLYDETESQSYGHVNRARSGYAQASLGPRRVTSGGMPVMLH